jgi:hypothetical protein
MKSYVSIRNKEGELINLNTEEDIKFIGVEEDIFGRDVLEFEYEEDIYKSLVWTK